MNHWSRGGHHKKAILLCMALIPIWDLAIGMMLDFSLGEFIFSITLGYLILNYIALWPIDRMPKWLRNLTTKRGDR